MQDFEHKKREILHRIDLLDVVGEHVTLKRSGQRWVGLCPFHAEKTPSFTVRPEHGSFKCFGCGKGGDVFSFVQFRENVPFIEAMRMLADRAGVELGATAKGAADGPGRADIARVNAWAAKFFRARLSDERLGRAARGYLEGRGVSAEMAERFGLGLAAPGSLSLQQAAAKAGVDAPLLLAADLVRRGESGDDYETFRNRLIFPIRDTTGRVVGFGGRTLVDDRAKYLNTRQTVLFDKGSGVYGVDVARETIAKRGRSVVVEGYMDCIAAHQAGFCETVATLGTALSEAQVDLLRRYAETIILLFDSDDAGQKAADRAIRVALPRCVTVRLARIPDGKDPSDYLMHASASGFSDVLNGAVDALEFRWLKTREGFERNESNSGRREAVTEFLRVVAEAVDATVIDPIQRGLLVNQVAHLLRMDRAEVDALMRRLRSKRQSGQAPTAQVRREPERAAPVGGEQAAWVQVIEVLLSEPGVWSEADALPDAGRIADQRDRRIAEVVLELAAKGNGTQLADVLARFHEPALIERITELADRGARRGNYENTYQAGLERIQQALRNDATERSRQECISTPTRDDSEGQRRDQLDALSSGVRAHRGFVPRRRIRQATESLE